MPILPNLVDTRGKLPRQAVYYAGWRPVLPVHIRSEGGVLKGARAPGTFRSGTGARPGAVSWEFYARE